jgi:hypothetical protein
MDHGNHITDQAVGTLVGRLVGWLEVPNSPPKISFLVLPSSFLALVTSHTQATTQHRSHQAEDQITCLR